MAMIVHACRRRRLDFRACGRWSAAIPARLASRKRPGSSAVVDQKAKPSGPACSLRVEVTPPSTATESNPAAAGAWSTPGERQQAHRKPGQRPAQHQ